MVPRKSQVLAKPALRLEQDPKHPLFLVAMTANELLSVAGIAHVSRDRVGKLDGYQRPEVRRHVRNIVEYLDSGDVLFPNSIIIALSEESDFEQAKLKSPQVGATHGTLHIPVPAEGARKTAWVVDGQQRLMALSKSQKRDMLVPVNAFFASDVAMQRDQFLRINSAKPLPRGLITELLPEIATKLPAKLDARRVPSMVCDILNRDDASAFYGLIHRPSMTKTAKRFAVIADTSVIQMIQTSLTSATGCLFPYHNVAMGTTDLQGIREILTVYWNAVRDTFPEAWGLAPRDSRLMHGAGIRALGRVMDRVMSNIDAADPKAPSRVRRELAIIRPACQWTEGSWEGLRGLPWNEVQNTPSSIRALGDYLLRVYRDRGRA